MSGRPAAVVAAPAAAVAQLRSSAAAGGVAAAAACGSQAKTWLLLEPQPSAVVAAAAASGCGEGDDDVVAETAAPPKKNGAVRRQRGTAVLAAAVQCDTTAGPAALGTADVVSSRLPHCRPESRAVVEGEAVEGVAVAASAVSRCYLTRSSTPEPLYSRGRQTAELLQRRIVAEWHPDRPVEAGHWAGLRAVCQSPEAARRRAVGKYARIEGTRFPRCSQRPQYSHPLVGADGAFRTAQEESLAAWRSQILARHHRSRSLLAFAAKSTSASLRSSP